MNTPVGSLSSSPGTPANLSSPSAMNRASNVSVRMLAVQFVSPNRIELIQLIVQQVAAIFCHQDRVSVVHERNIIKRSVVGVAQDNERYGSTVSVCVEIDAEDSAPGAARRQFRLYPRAIIRVASDEEEEGPKV